MRYDGNHLGGCVTRTRYEIRDRRALVRREVQRRRDFGPGRKDAVLVKSDVFDGCLNRARIGGHRVERQAQQESEADSVITTRDKSIVRGQQYGEIAMGFTSQ